MPAIARVQPLTRTRAVRGPFDYRIDPAQEPIGVGSVLRIPFGGRRTLGVVVALAAESEVPAERLAVPEEVLDASLPPDLVGLAEWMAREYCSTEARALSLVLAPGTAEGVRARRVLVAELTADGAAALADPGMSLTAGQRALLTRLAEQAPAVAASLGTPALRRLERRGLVTLQSRVHGRRPVERRLGSAEAVAPPLTADQADVLAPILDALRRGGAAGEPFLLHGVTGSGKTEIYLRAVQAALQAGRTAIVLVPEIALTPQVLWRFQVRFGDVVAVLHSALGAGERHDEWLRLRDGRARVCVGPRSAIFAPLPDLGLIIVDEEHESSYKHEGDPRYDARSVASERARRSGAVLVAGSATPRPESIHTMLRLRLPRRVDHRPMPHVEVLDMRGAREPLHPDTRMALADLRRAGGKAIVLLNRRGWSNFLSCRSCGHVWLCPDCEVALVLHRQGGYMACHHCGHRERVPERCGECGSVTVARHGAGTERIEYELRQALGGDGFPVFRLDADAATLERRAGILQSFAGAPCGVLVGTQMVAKGHDFPDVTLGVVLDADQTLRFPDFRAEERTFALITQLAGRTGRGTGAGRVLVQTLAPDARAIAYATRHDSDGFVADELRRREILSYPPYATLIRIICSAVEEGPAVSAATEIARRLPPSGPTVLGPAPLFRLRGRARSQLVIKASDRAAAIVAINTAVDGVAPGVARHGVNVSVDVDPQ
ncbi:MAG TPA: primosomal protein N' [Solirubrobacteraceae bacterium]|nr:primosomal protein N' [Solirubrobacteraceae bacterium]